MFAGKREKKNATVAVVPTVRTTEKKNQRLALIP